MHELLKAFLKALDRALKALKALKALSNAFIKALIVNSKALMAISKALKGLHKNMKAFFKAKVLNEDLKALSKTFQASQLMQDQAPWAIVLGACERKNEVRKA